MYYGTFRIDTPEGRKQMKVPLGTTKELPTKAAARKKLVGEIEKWSRPVPPTAGEITFSELAEKWRVSECVSLTDPTSAHYVNALRSLIPPAFKSRSISSIQRDDITKLINSQAEKYSKSSLRSLRLVLQMTLAWAEKNSLIKRPTGWLDGIRLPKKVGGRTVTRIELTPGQTLAIDIDGEVVCCVARAIADGEPGFRAKDLSGK
jgi:hypothetical protein